MRQDTVGGLPQHRRSTPPAAADGDPHVLLAVQVLLGRGAATHPAATRHRSR